MRAKDIKPIKKEEKKGINIFFILVEFVFCSFVIAGFSMDMPFQAVLSAVLAIAITPFPDYVLVKLGKNPMNRNLKFAIGAIGFVLLCYLVPDKKIGEVRQRQIDNMMMKQEKALDETELDETTLGETALDETTLGE